MIDPFTNVWVHLAWFPYLTFNKLRLEIKYFVDLLTEQYTNKEYIISIQQIILNIYARYIEQYNGICLRLCFVLRIVHIRVFVAAVCLNIYIYYINILATIPEIIHSEYIHTRKFSIK